MSLVTTGFDFEAIASRAWRHHPYPAERFDHIRGMVDAEERRMLHWLGHHAGYDGCFVDAGAFLGRTAAHLADGLLDHPNRLKKVHSFEAFRPSPHATREFGVESGEAMFRTYAANVSPWMDRIIVYPGDIRHSGWMPQPIEILLLDVLKTSALNDFVAGEFFPHLIPGRSVLIQQDFIGPHLPWIHVTMGLYAEHFSYLADTGLNSVLFRCDSVPSVEGLRYESLSPAARYELFDVATERFTEPEARRRLAEARRRIDPEYNAARLAAIRAGMSQREWLLANDTT